MIILIAACSINQKTQAAASKATSANGGPDDSGTSI